MVQNTNYNKDQDYFHVLGEKLLRACPVKERMELSTEIAGAHHHHLAGKTGLFDLLKPETIKWMKPIVDEFQTDWESTHPKQNLDIRNSSRGSDIQWLYEAIDEVGRNKFQELFRNEREL